MSYQPPAYLSQPDQEREEAFVKVLRAQVDELRALAQASIEAGDIETWRSWIVPMTNDAEKKLTELQWATRMTSHSAHGT